MKSEHSRRGWLRWLHAVVLLGMLGSLFGAAEADAQVQTFFVVVPQTLQGEERDAYQECAERLNASLVNTGLFRANADAETQRTVSDCIGETASASAKRQCELSIANVQVDWLMMLSSRRIGGDWKWGVAALSPAEGGAQKWGGDEKPAGVGDRVGAAYAACDLLGKRFACEQGVERACVGSEFGAGPVLGGENAVPAAAEGGAGRARPRQVTVSALDVFEATPQVVSVWIDGKEAGTSENQITGVPAGSHTVTLKATGYFDHTEQVTFAAGLPSELKGVRLRKTTATLRVEMIEPSVATVFIGGRERGTTAAPLAGIAPGEAEVVLRAEGYRERRERLTLEADGERTLRDIRLEPLPAALTVRASVMGAEVVVDGAVIGTTSGGEDLFEVAPSATRLEVRRRGYSTYAQRLELAPGGAETVRVELSRGDATQVAGSGGGCPVGYVRIAPGSFTMGSPNSEEGRDDDETQHRVTITRAYCLKATEVTQGEWQAVMGSNPSQFTGCGANCPVEQVSWEDAVRFANALSKREGLQECYRGSDFVGVTCTGYRLPTEAEWEYAARAGTTSALYTGNLTIRGQNHGPELNSIAWYGGNSGVNYSNGFDCSGWAEKQFASSTCGPHPVATKTANAWGLYDMLGNVWEWTSDWYGSYPSGTTSDPAGAQAGSYRVFRGGSWFYDARSVRAAYRHGNTPGYRSYSLGFRLSRTAP